MLKLYQKVYPEKDTAPPVKDKQGSVVQWLALWTLNPEIRVQVSAEPTPWVYVSPFDVLFSKYFIRDVQKMKILNLLNQGSMV